VTTAATAYSYPIANHTDLRAVYAVDMKETVPAIYPTGRGILSVKASRASLLYSNSSSPNLTTRDNTANQNNSGLGTIQDIATKAGCVYDTTELVQLALTSSAAGYSGDTVYSGDHGVTTDIVMGHTMDHVMGIRNIQRYDINNLAAGKSLLTKLMNA
jgi:hypothetical protein